MQDETLFHQSLSKIYQSIDVENITSFNNICILGVSIIVLAIVWKLLKSLISEVYSSFFHPLDRFIDLEPKLSEMKPSTRTSFLASKSRKRIGDFPPVYPNGWFKICNSWDLSPGQVIYKSMLGLELAVYRAQHSKTVHAIDAYCTHLGANLSLGSVNGECLTCPFHHWSFNGEGKCVSVGDSPLPMPILKKNGQFKSELSVQDSTLDIAKNKSGKLAESCEQVEECEHRDGIPSQAHTKSYTIIERNDNVYLWFDAEGREPHWQPPSVRQNLFTHGKIAHHIYCHIQEIPENGPDANHLNVVHREMRNTFGFVWNIWGAKWQKGEKKEDSHVAYFQVQHVSTAMNDRLKIPFSVVDVKGGQYGPGLVMFEFSTILGKFDLVQTVTPVGPLHQHVEHVLYVPWYIPRFFAKWFLILMTSFVEQDIPIWNTKTYLPKPVLVRTDGPIGQFRRWYSQFYSENSPTLKSLSKRSLEW
ncbi:iron-sulfur cluster-binding protein, Rieske family [Naegleria gruberi]|uniref:cholesterol 7-desaturase n=1 Tax=Naegleria gruberi TaxID=5762 RepID=D2V079_NAEGR|nr:iron-sulfur cluster-binding protein, Rieske family [Naegleria gruberi]EFC49671.1 iron-sulfur cluster-binding protein, Rieske family [Naegleria gruberi]|eukprot:XP_002682415.1 iron-sulfur cluster-binding protein, Rieske family [Naegleria gruberi strain NEG-M]